MKGYAEDCGIYPVVCDVDDERKFLKSLNKVGARFGTTIVCFNADLMAGSEHVRSALAHAARTWDEGTQISRSLAMEALLYAGGTRQCLEATRFGIHPGHNSSHLCLCPDSVEALAELKAQGMIAPLPAGESLEEISSEKTTRLMDCFGITPEEIAVVGEERFSELVLERVALLEVHK